jgi:hypothetical protein
MILFLKYIYFINLKKRKIIKEKLQKKNYKIYFNDILKKLFLF